MRQKYNLQGSIAEDVLKAGCCLCCSVMQAEKESKLLLGGKCTGLDGVVDEQYMASVDEKMIMVPQAYNKLNIQPTPLHRISEETPPVEFAQGTSYTNSAALDDVMVATVVDEQGTKQVSATIQTDGAMDMAVVSAADTAVPPDTTAETELAGESAVVHVESTEPATTSGQSGATI